MTQKVLQVEVDFLQIGCGMKINSEDIKTSEKGMVWSIKKWTSNVISTYNMDGQCVDRMMVYKSEVMGRILQARWTAREDYVGEIEISMHDYGTVQIWRFIKEILKPPYWTEEDGIILGEKDKPI